MWTISDFPMRQTETPAGTRFGHDWKTLAGRPWVASGFCRWMRKHGRVAKRSRSTVSLTVLVWV
jgi:hypothetical protein